MQLCFKREELLKPLTHVAGVVERRQTLPILSFVLLRREGEGITLTGTDLEVEVTVRVAAAERKGEAMTAPARKLLDICRALPPGAEIEIRKDGDRAIIKAGRSRFSLMSLPAEDFPAIDAANWDASAVLPEAALRTLLENTHFCMAQQDVRYYLNGLLLELGKGVLRAVATDGHRMALSEARATVEGEARQAIVPRKGIGEIIRVLENDEAGSRLDFSNNHVRLSTEQVVLTAKLIDGRYPDYSKVLPATHNKQLRIGREALREALSRVAILSNEKYRGVRVMAEEGVLRLTAHNPEQEEAHEELAAEYSGEGIEIGFNVSYLSDAVAALSAEEVVIELSDPNNSCLVKAPDSTHPQYVIMPMRL